MRLQYTQQNDDEVTQDKYPNCSFFIPKTRVITPTMSMLAINENIVQPSNFGGLYLTRVLSKLTDGQSSPLAQSLLVNNDYQITLSTPNSGTNAINGFIPSSQQIGILRANKTKIDQVHNSLTGSLYNTGSPFVIWASDLATGVGGNYNFWLFGSNNYAVNNPSSRPGASNYRVAVVYPF